MSRALAPQAQAADASLHSRDGSRTQRSCLVCGRACTVAEPV